MNYYWFNKQELLQKAKEKYDNGGKEKEVFVLNLVNTGKTIVSDKFKHSDDGFKYFIGYLHDDDVIDFCVLFYLK